MEDGRVVGFGRPSESDAALARWARRAAEARAAAARGGAGPPGGTARERTRLVRALSRARFHRTMSDDTTVRKSKPKIILVFQVMVELVLLNTPFSRFFNRFTPCDSM